MQVLNEQLDNLVRNLPLVASDVVQETAAKFEAARQEFKQVQTLLGAEVPLFPSLQGKVLMATLEYYCLIRFFRPIWGVGPLAYKNQALQHAGENTEPALAFQDAYYHVNHPILVDGVLKHFNDLPAFQSR